MVTGSLPGRWEQYRLLSLLSYDFPLALPLCGCITFIILLIFALVIELRLSNASEWMAIGLLFMSYF